MVERNRYLQYAWIAIFTGVLAWSGVDPHDYPTWWLEVLPALIGAALIWYTRDTFPLTRLAYVLILVHCIILMVGGHYTYAEVPLFDRIGEILGHTRNNYDKLGHFAQGFIPAIVAREIVVRKDVFNSTRWRDFFIVSFCLAFSAFYELIEWWVAALGGGRGIFPRHAGLHVGHAVGHGLGIAGRRASAGRIAEVARQSTAGQRFHYLKRWIRSA